MPNDFDDSQLFSPDYKSPDSFNDDVIFDPGYQTPAPKQPERGDFISGVYSGSNSFMSLMNYSKAAIGALTDNEEWMKEGIKTAQGYEEKAASYGVGRVTNWDDVNNASDFVDYFQYGLGTLAPYAAESMVAGIAGGVAGSAAAPGVGTVTGTLGGMVAKQALKETIKQYTKGKLKGLSKDQVEKKIRKNFKEYAEGKILPGNKAMVESAMKRTSAKMGATMGSMTATLPIGQGDIASNMIEKDDTLTKESAAIATGLAIPYAALDVLPEFVGISRLLAPGGGGALKRTATGFISQAPLEAATEVAQEEINIRTRAAHDPEFDPMGREAMVQRRESAILGGAGGGVFGGATGLMQGQARDVQPLELDVASNISKIDKSEFGDVADYNQTIIDGIYDSATELTGDANTLETGRRERKPVDPNDPRANQRKMDSIIPEIGEERRGQLVDMDEPLPIGQRIDQLYNEAVSSGGNINQYIIDGLYGKTGKIVDHGQQQALSDTQTKQIEIEKREAALGRALSPDEMTELSAQFPVDSRETSSIIPPTAPDDYDRGAVESQLKDLYADTKRLETESKGQTVQNYVAGSGGIDFDEAVSQGIDPADIKAANKKGMPFGMPLFKRGGKSFDEVAELLGEADVQSVMDDGAYSLNAALDLIQTFVTGGEPEYMPADEMRALDIEGELRTKAGLTEQLENQLSEIDKYEQIQATEGTEAAEDFFYESRAVDLYSEMEATGEISMPEDEGEILYNGEPVTADTQFDEQGEALSTLIDEAAKVNPELAEKEFERLVDESDADIAKAMNAIISGEADERVTEEEKRVSQGGVAPVQAEKAEEAGRRKESKQVDDERRAGDRRTHKTDRKRVSEMSPEEKDLALLTNEKSGLRNERAYEEDERLAHQSFFDIDNFKEINTEYTYDGADLILKAFGDIMTAAGNNDIIPYHLHGDEFIVQSDSYPALKAFSERVQQELSNKEITIELPSGEIKVATNTGASYGIGKTKEQAESNLKQDKEARAEQGLRAEREREPGGLPEQVAPGEPDLESVVTTEDIGAFPGMATAEHITGEAEKAAASPVNDKPVPTKEQIEAESYAKGHPVIQGLDIAIENPAGSKRKPEWPVMAAHYGDVVGYIGADGDAVDVFVNPDVDIPADNPVFIINQYVKGEFDEHKTMMGFADKDEALKAYDDSYIKGWRGAESIHELSIDEFKNWLDTGDITAEYQPEKDLVAFPGTETDLLGDDVSALQAEADAKRAVDEKLSGTEDVPMAAGEGDLFGDADKQVDIEDVEKAEEPTQEAPEIPDTGITDEQDIVEPEVKGVAKSSYGAENKLVSQDDYTEIQRKLKEKLGKLNSGIDPELITLGTQAAVYHIEAGARSFAQFSSSMVADFGDTIKPYLRSWYEAARYYPGADATGMTSAAEIELSTGEDYATGKPDDLESDRGIAAVTERMGGADVSIKPGADDPYLGTTVTTDERVGLRQQADTSLPDSDAPLPGTDGNLELFESDGTVRASASITRRDERTGGRAADAEGISPGRKTNKQADGDARSTESEHTALRRKQRNAVDLPVKLNDAKNIDETLPVLFPEQRDDVLYAEARFFTANKKGVLFTNGTGTGKTYTGLGIAKRFYQRGKKRILITVPTDAKAKDWIEDGQNVDLPISQLSGISDADSGVVITTYANFRDNEAIVAEDWDLVIYDESHYLNSNKAADNTASHDRHHEITNHEKGYYRKAQVLTPEYQAASAEIDEVRADIEKEKKVQKEAGKGGYRAESLAKGKFKIRHDKAMDAMKLARVLVSEKEVELRAQPDNVKVVMLSASPFAYDKNIDYAEGYLFDYDKVEDSQGYNVPDSRQSFFVEHFGYRMRFNKLTEPEPEVNRDLMERQFHQWMRDQGALSGRVLSVDKDYSRQFIEVQSGIGEDIDRGYSILTEYDSDLVYKDKSGNEQTGRNVYPILGKITQKKFDYHYTMRLLEAVKTQGAIDRAKQHIALGRKVVVFHGYNEGQPDHPFLFRSMTEDEITQIRRKHGKDAEERAIEYNAEVERFNTENADILALDLSGLVNPINAFSREFGDRLALFNGRIPKKKRRSKLKEFNRDGSGTDVILLQIEAGKEGLSAHDVTGTHQRVMMQLGLPLKPVDAIQTEGRTFRLGVMSNAIFEYLKVGTSMESYKFGTTISRRSRTAENLALGDQARDLERSFIEAYLDSTAELPSENQGTGGKSSDARVLNESEFDAAISFYYGNQKRTAKNKAKEGRDYFATPEPLGQKMVGWLGLKPGERAGEPSAGHGAISRWFGEENRVTVVEPSKELFGRLSMHTRGNLINERFEDLDLHNKFDGIAMNPPFGTGGKMAMEHLAKAFKHLRNGGRIIAIVPEGSSMEKRFDKWYESKDAADAYKMREIKLPAVLFKRAGTQVNTRIIVLDKYTNKEEVPAQGGTIDLTSYNNINDFFDAIRDLDIAERGEVAEIEAEETEEQETARLTGEVVEEAKKVDVSQVSGAAAAKAEIIAGEHTKHGYPIWTVKLNERVGKDVFNDLKDEAKKLKGRYSFYSKDGAIPGFIFKNEEQAKQFMQAFDAGDSVVYQRGSKGIGMRVSQVQRVVDRLQKKYKGTNAARIIVRKDDVDAFGEKIPGKAVKGGFDPKTNTVTILAHNMNDEADVLKTIRHEVFTHFGFRQMMNESEFQEFLDLVREARGTNDEIASIYESVIKAYPDLVTEPYKLAEEVVARVSERDVKAPLMDKIRALITKLLRRIGLVDAPITRAEINILIDKSAENLKKELDNPRIDTGDQMYAADKPVFYSQMLTVLEKKLPGKGQVGQFKMMINNMANNGDFKKEELEWSGVNEWLDNREGKITKDEVLSFINSQEVADQAKTPEFKKWFGSSKVVDNNGDPLVLYHGTASDIFEFKGVTFGSQNSELANDYAMLRSEISGKPANIMPVYMSIKTPFDADLNVSRTVTVQSFFDAALKQSEAYGKTLSANELDKVDDYLSQIKLAARREESGPHYDRHQFWNNTNSFFGEDGAKAINELFKLLGFDGIKMQEHGSLTFGAFGSAQVKSVTGNIGAFDPSDPNIMFQRENPEFESARAKIGKKGRHATLAERYNDIKGTLGLRFRQGVIDRYGSLMKLDNTVWKLARGTHHVAGAVEAAFKYGKIRLDEDGALDIDTGGKGLAELLSPLGHEIDDFMFWMIGNRAYNLKQEGREHLFDDAEINAFRSRNQGTMSRGRDRAEVYEQARKDMMDFQQSILDIGIATDAISKEESDTWNKEFYIPFYRILEDQDGNEKVRGAQTLDGLTGQTAIKRLKGGTKNLNDPLANVLMNWHHVLSAAMKNQAATATVLEATEAGIMEPVSKETKSDKAFFIRVAGQKRWFDVIQDVENPIVPPDLVLEALTMMNQPMWNNTGMKALRQFKRIFTIGVTAAPEFRIANLLRDTMHSVAVGKQNYNLFDNVYEGWKGTEEGSDIEKRMMAGGGTIHFGLQYGDDPESARMLIKEHIDAETILTDEHGVKKYRHALKGMWTLWRDFGNRIENVNRAALYKKRIGEGATHFEAAHEARDLLDFFQGGSWPAVRFLTQTVPFLNARLQGLDKMYRAGIDDSQKKQLYIVLGAYIAATMALYLLYRDDEDFKAREEWDRDSYHWFKAPGSDIAFRLPKPFEVGAIGTIAERALELAIDDEAHVDLFAERLGHVFWQTFEFDPVPQAARPVLNVYANKDPFTKRPIESVGMSKLSPEKRAYTYTSETAIGLSKAINSIKWDKVALSPIQIEYLIGGYLGWAGSFSLGAIDNLISRPVAEGEFPFMGESRPERSISEWPITRRFVQELPIKRTKYVTMLYENLKEINTIYADLANYRKLGELEKAREIMAKNRDYLSMRKIYNSASKKITSINNKMRRVRGNKNLTAKQKKAEIDRLRKLKNAISKRIIERTGERMK